MKGRRKWERMVSLFLAEMKKEKMGVLIACIRNEEKGLVWFNLISGFFE